MSAVCAAKLPSRTRGVLVAKKKSVSRKKKTASKTTRVAKKTKTPRKATAAKKPAKAAPRAKAARKAGSARKARSAATAPPAQIEPMDLERIVELDFIRTTEAAALNAYRWLGKGDPRRAHAAAVDALRGTLDLISIAGTVLFGDGLNPQRAGLQPNDKVGNWHKGALKVTLAAIPIDGADLVARGRWGALSMLVAVRSDADSESALFQAPCQLMHKIAYGPAVKAGPGQVHLGASVRDNLEIIAGKLGKRIMDLTVALLDREYNQHLVDDIRQAGASARLFGDGDVACMMAPSLPDTGIDVYMGIGGSVETVVASAAVKCLDGDILARVVPKTKPEKAAALKALGPDAESIQLHAGDLAHGDNIVFCATGVTDGSVLRGIHINGHTASTSSVVMRSRYGTVRRIAATHDLSRKTIRSYSHGESKL